MACSLSGHFIFAGEGHLGPVTDIVVDGETFYSCSGSGVFSGAGASLRFVARPKVRVTSLVRRDLDKAIYFAGGMPGEWGAFGKLDLTDVKDRSAVKLGKDLVYDLAVDESGSFLVAACSDGKVLSVPTGPDANERRLWHQHTAPARAVAISRNGKWLASGGLDGAVIVSRTGRSGDAPRQLLDHSAGVECLAWSPDSTLLASGSRDSKVRLHDAEGRLVRTYRGLGMEDEPVAGRVESRVLALAWSEDGILAGTSKGSLYRLSLTDDTFKRLPRRGRNAIFSLAIRANSEILIGTHSLVEVLVPPKEIPLKTRGDR
jgi:WD40 repeat protein